MSIPVSRDMTVFGGKVGFHKEKGLHTIHPYFLPYSKPKKATLASDLNGGERSFRLLEFSYRMVSLIDSYREHGLTIGDLIEQRIGVPFTNLKSLEGKIAWPNANKLLLDYIKDNQTVLRENLNAVLEEIAS